MDKLSFVESELKSREAMNRKRELASVAPIRGMEVRVKGRPMINFCSNDYLGLSKHPLLRERAVEYMERYGAGSTGSRLVCGTYDYLDPLEHKLAALKGSESALLLNSGFQANVSILPALTDRETLILSDELNHNSIVQGILLSRCRVLRYRHNDLEHLKGLLEKNRRQGFSRILIATESVFSVDGDRSDIDALVELASDFQALLFVDEAHATGVLGPRGMGLASGKPVDMVMGTFGKACGSYGAYAACSRALRDFLVNRCWGFIYSTALPPAVAGSIDAGLDLIPSMGKDRAALLRSAEHLRKSLQAQGFDTGNSTTQIVPVIVGDDRRALALSERLEEEGLFAKALRPPTVPEGRARIRLSLSSTHTPAQLSRLISVFAEGSGAKGRPGSRLRRSGQTTAGNE